MKEYKYKINGKSYHVTVNEVEDNIAKVEVNGNAYEVEMEKKETPKVSKPVQRETPVAASKPAARPASPKPAGKNAGIQSPLPGVIVEIKVAVGDTVKRGQTVLILEAMKMENNINATLDGVVAEILVGKGDSVLEGNDLIVLE